MTSHILNHFNIHDPVLHKYAIAVGDLKPIIEAKPQVYFHRLTEAIVCQQLSERAGDTIFKRFTGLFDKPVILPGDILSTDHEKLRTSGISNSKANYIRNLAEAVSTGRLKFDLYAGMPDEEIIADLIQVKGIGRWTAEMFLIFTLNRPDVFSFGDLGLKRGIMKIFNLPKEPAAAEMERISVKWSPYRSYASRILWAALAVK